MALVHLAKALLPAEVSQTLLTRGQATFAASFADTLLLLIRVEENDELGVGLLATATGDGSTTFLPTRRLDYNTEAHTPEMLRAMLAAANRGRQQQTQAIADALGRGRHVAVALRKRAGADQISVERISVGRAGNKDIVLRDGSVSKFHAWFELFDGRDFSLADAGSKNLTRVNDEPLAARSRHRLTPGDSIRFGSVQALLCEAESLWSAIHPEQLGGSETQ